MIASRSHSCVGLLEVLRGQEDGRALLVDAPDLVPDRQPARGVQAGRRLVEEQHVGPVHERGGEVQPALHAARVALDAAVGRVLELDQREQLVARARRPRRRQRRTAGPAGSSSSRPLWRGSSPASCSATPMRRRTASGSRATSTPATRGGAADVIDSSVVSILTVVDLPAPLGPGSRRPRRPRRAGRRRARPRRSPVVGLDQPARLDGGRPVSVAIHGHRTAYGAGTHRGCLLRKCYRLTAPARRETLGAKGEKRNPEVGVHATTSSWSGGRRDVRAGVRRRRDRGDRRRGDRRARGRVRVRHLAAGDGLRDRPDLGLPHQPGRDVGLLVSRKIDARRGGPVLDRRRCSARSSPRAPARHRRQVASRAATT